MDDLQHVGYSKEVIEFVAVAKEFCGYLESAQEEERFSLQSAEIYPVNLFEGEFVAELRE